MIAFEEAKAFSVDIVYIKEAHVGSGVLLYPAYRIT